jgi:beta-mannosidase
VNVPGRSAVEVAGDALLETFVDSARAYRFGPPGHDVAVATLLDGENVLAETCWLYDFASPPSCSGIEGIIAGDFVSIRTKRFAHAVALRMPGFSTDDDYFDLAPGSTRKIRFRPIEGAKPRAPGGELFALNLRVPVLLEQESA